MTLYFAYGTNMDRAGMRLRCPDAQAVRSGVLEGWRMLVMREGYVSIMREPGARVHGVLWRLAPPDIAALDDYEAVEAGLYRRLELPVLTGGRSEPAQVYVGCSDTPGTPRPGHLACVIGAAQAWALPPAYIDELRRLAGPEGLAEQGQAE